MDSTEKVTDSKEEEQCDNVEAVQEFRVYKKRWLVMVSLMLLNLSISMVSSNIYTIFMDEISYIVTNNFHFLRKKYLL